ncbi:hypothetical protein BDZ94DRAFT_378295 [Collybia nuda]|uniref:C3H1-type domain-containing protein n=1 Tax=Collybia nuda TaxID=64659 RepID=A0A9P5YKR3_9AGAR|nr:hypothetical protein BDZ94DRAFT_378295 [Collybia nuda]
MTLQAPAWRVQTRPCPFYQQGRCIFSDSCNFLHIMQTKSTGPVRATHNTPPFVTIQSPQSVRSPPRSPRLSDLLYVLQDVIGKDTDEDLEPVMDGATFCYEEEPTLLGESGGKFKVSDEPQPFQSPQSVQEPTHLAESGEKVKVTDKPLPSHSPSKAQEPVDGSGSLSTGVIERFVVDEPLSTSLFHNTEGQPSIRTIQSSPDAAEPPASHTKTGPSYDLLSPVELSHLNLGPLSMDFGVPIQDGDIIDSGYGETWKTPCPLVRSPPRSPMNSTFDLLSSPFGSPSARVLSPRLSAFISRSPLSPRVAASTEDEDYVPTDFSLDSPANGPSTTFQPTEPENETEVISEQCSIFDDTEAADGVFHHHPEEEEPFEDIAGSDPTNIWDSEGQSTSVYLGVPPLTPEEVSGAMQISSSTPIDFLEKSINFVDDELIANSSVNDSTPPSPFLLGVTEPSIQSPKDLAVFTREIEAPEDEYLSQFGSTAPSPSDTKPPSPIGATASTPDEELGEGKHTQNDILGALDGKEFLPSFPTNETSSGYEQVYYDEHVADGSPIVSASKDPPPSLHVNEIDTSQQEFDENERPPTRSSSPIVKWSTSSPELIPYEEEYVRSVPNDGTLTPAAEGISSPSVFIDGVAPSYEQKCEKGPFHDNSPNASVLEVSHPSSPAAAAAATIDYLEGEDQPWSHVEGDATPSPMDIVQAFYGEEFDDDEDMQDDGLDVEGFYQSFRTATSAYEKEVSGEDLPDVKIAALDNEDSHHSSRTTISAHGEGFSDKGLPDSNFTATGVEDFDRLPQITTPIFEEDLDGEGLSDRSFAAVPEVEGFHHLFQTATSIYEEEINEEEVSGNDLTVSGDEFHQLPRTMISALEEEPEEKDFLDDSLSEPTIEEFHDSIHTTATYTTLGKDLDREDLTDNSFAEPDIEESYHPSFRAASIVDEEFDREDDSLVELDTEGFCHSSYPTISTYEEEITREEPRDDATPHVETHHLSHATIPAYEGEVNEEGLPDYSLTAVDANDFDQPSYATTSTFEEEISGESFPNYDFIATDTQDFSVSSSIGMNTSVYEDGNERFPEGSPTAQLAYLTSPNTSAVLPENDTLYSIYDDYSGFSPKSNGSDLPFQHPQVAAIKASPLSSPHPPRPSIFHERVFTPPPTAKEQFRPVTGKSASPAPSTSSSIRVGASPRGRTSSRSQHSQEARSAWSPDSQEDQPQEIQSSKKVPFGFRHSLAMRGTVDSIPRRLSRTSPQSFSDSQIKSSQSDRAFSPEASPTSPVSGGLRPLRLVRFWYLQSIRFLILCRSLCFFALNHFQHHLAILISLSIALVNLEISIAHLPHLQVYHQTVLYQTILCFHLHVLHSYPNIFVIPCPNLTIHLNQPITHDFQNMWKNLIPLPYQPLHPGVLPLLVAIQRSGMSTARRADCQNPLLGMKWKTKQMASMRRITRTIKPFDSLCPLFRIRRPLPARPQ